MNGWLILLTIIAILVDTWFFIIWLPDRIHASKLGRKYGWPSEKQSAIRRLFVDGTITSIGYGGATYDPDQEFVLIIRGPFGMFDRRGTGNILHTEDDSSQLPAEVTEAFDGYIDTVSDVVRLLDDFKFLQGLMIIETRRIRVGKPAPGMLAIIAD